MIGPHTVTVINPTGRDRWGDTRPGGTETPVSGCFWQPRSSSEQTGGQDTVTMDAWVSMPPSAPVFPTSQVEFQGVVYDVHGEPALHHTPAGPHHYEVELTQVKG